MSTLSPARARSSTKTIAIGRAASDVYADLADLSHWPQRAGEIFSPALCPARCLFPYLLKRTRGMEPP